MLITDGLLAAWNFDEGGIDSTANANDLTPNGGIATVNGYATFNGTTQYYSTASNSCVQIANQPLTVYVRFEMSDLDTDHYILAKEDEYWLLYSKIDGDFRFVVRRAGYFSDMVILAPTSAVPAVGEVFHLLFVWQPDLPDLWSIDLSDCGGAIEARPSPFWVPTPTANPFQIGRRATYPLMAGNIYTVMLWDRVAGLGGDECATLYNGGAGYELSGGRTRTTARLKRC